MDIADLVMIAEDRHAERLERKDEARDKAVADLVSEFMAAATLPTLSTVSTPTDLNPARRTPFLDAFSDGLFWSKNVHLQSRAVAVLMRHDRELVEELARQYAEDYADEVAQ